jgi:hypothetical protein
LRDGGLYVGCALPLPGTSYALPFAERRTGELTSLRWTVTGLRKALVEHGYDPARVLASMHPEWDDREAEIWRRLLQEMTP